MLFASIINIVQQEGRGFGWIGVGVPFLVFFCRKVTRRILLLITASTYLASLVCAPIVQFPSNKWRGKGHALPCDGGVCWFLSHHPRVLGFFVVSSPRGVHVNGGEGEPYSLDGSRSPPLGPARSNLPFIIHTRQLYIHIQRHSYIRT